MVEDGIAGKLAQEMEVEVAYVRSKDGKTRVIPVWFTLNAGRIELLPMYGVKTKWFADVEKRESLELRVAGWRKVAKPRIVRDPDMVDDIRGRFSLKYGKGDVNRYYPTSEVALEVQL